MVPDLMFRVPGTTPHAVRSDEQPPKLVTATVVKFYDACRKFYDTAFCPYIVGKGLESSFRLCYWFDQPLTSIIQVTYVPFSLGSASWTHLPY